MNKKMNEGENGWKLGYKVVRFLSMSVLGFVSSTRTKK